MTKRIAAVPLWYRPEGKLPKTMRFDHVCFENGGPVCGMACHQLTAIPLQIPRRCPKCVEWLRNRGTDTPASAATFADVFGGEA